MTAVYVQLPKTACHYQSYLSYNGRVVGFSQPISEAQALRVFRRLAGVRRVETPTQIYLNSAYLQPVLPLCRVHNAAGQHRRRGLL